MHPRGLTPPRALLEGVRAAKGLTGDSSSLPVDTFHDPFKVKVIKDGLVFLADFDIHLMLSVFTFKLESQYATVPIMPASTIPPVGVEFGSYRVFTVGDTFLNFFVKFA